MAVELEKIEFKDFQEPAVGAENLNKLQDNTQKALDKKQDTLTAGDNITIENGVISSSGVSIETITNENGTAIKFPDGTMICRGIKTYGAEPFIKNENVYYRQLEGVTFPVPFIEIPTPSVDMAMGNIGSISAGSGVSTTQIYGFNVMSAVQQERGITVYWLAIGKWK